MLGRLAVAAIALVALAAAAVATADRKATQDERRAIAKVVELPTKCTKARISTVTPGAEVGRGIVEAQAG
jgi:hypothetical protein